MPKIGPCNYATGYVGAPYVKGSPTSKAAALAVLPRIGTQRHKILEYLKKCGKVGATDEEIQRHLGIKSDSETPRRGELVQGDHVVDSGRTRKTTMKCEATVWVIKKYGSKKCKSSTEKP